MTRAIALLLVALLLAGCNRAPADDAPAPTATPTPPDDAPPTSTPAPEAPSFPPFPRGLLYRLPNGSLAGVPGIELLPHGFDVGETLLVQGDGRDGLRLVRADGSETRLALRGLDRVARPALSPDGHFVAIEATEGPQAREPADTNIYLVELATGAFRRVSPLDEVPEGSPAWSPDGDSVAFASFPAEDRIDLHVVAPTGREKLVLADAGAAHLALSPDGRRVLDAGRLRILDVETGELIADLREAALEGARAAGHAPDERSPGAAGRGAFPLAGAFSPEGDRVVFDGIVARDGGHAALVMSIGADGSGFRVEAGPFDVDPHVTDGFRRSELDPLWR